MLRMCIDARMLFSSGIGTCLKALIPYLCPSETSLLIRKEDKDKLPWLSSYHLIPCSSPIYSIKEQWELPAKIPRCDLFWSPHYNIPLLPIRAKKRVVTIHDAAHLAFKSSQNFKQNVYASVMFRQAVRRSDVVVTDSLFSRDELCRYLSVPQEKIRVIGMGMDQEKFSQELTQSQIGAIRKKYQLPEQFLLFVGNLKPHKNLQLLVEGYQTGRISLPLVVVGKMQGLLTVDPMLQKIHSDAALRQKIHFAEEVLDQEMVAFYQMASVFIFPSLYEGFGLPPLEAMASGCPVIASRAASLPEVCGEAVYWIDPCSVSELTSGIDRLLSESEYRQELIRKGRERVCQFQWDKTASQYLQLF